MPASGSVPASGPLLVVEGVVKRFGGHTALGGISLSIHPGEIIALAGENGAGKSTLMAICSGALAPDEGTLHWEGHPSALPELPMRCGPGSPSSTRNPRSSAV